LWRFGLDGAGWQALLQAAVAFLLWNLSFRRWMARREQAAPGPGEPLLVS
jgi:hypothetical protein